jgi:hypothetical protein
MASLAAHAWRHLVRFRYLLILAACGLASWPGYEQSAHNRNDWVVFEVGARTMVHYHHLSMYQLNPLHLYADNHMIQIGPPPLLLVAAVQWLTPLQVNLLFVGVMALMGVAALAAVEGAARRLAGEQSHTPIAHAVLLTGIPIAFVWGYFGAEFHHLDDAMAVLGTTVAVYLGVTRRPTWLVGVVLGTAIASKPWAIIFAPLLLGLPRRERAIGVLAFLAAAAAWWAPFVIAAPNTISALGSLHILPFPGSVLYLFGVHTRVEHWLRPVQFDVGLAAAFLAARRHPWSAAPLAGLAVRIATDPYVWPYYGLAPVLMVLLWEASTMRSRVPWWTCWTVAAMFLVRLVAPATMQGVVRLTWVLTILGAISWQILRRPTTQEALAPVPRAEPALA